MPGGRVAVLLVGGAYEAQGIIANGQRCVNLYQEKNPPQDAPVPITHYLTPGLQKEFKYSLAAPVRTLYATANQDSLIAVIDTDVIHVDSANNVKLLGQIASKPTPVSIADNGVTAVLVDGTPNVGYTIDLATLTFTKIVDEAFLGGVRAKFLDTYLLFNQPDTQVFFSTKSQVVTPFDGLYYASKDSGNDNLVSMEVVHRELWLLGSETTEIWQDVGGALFPFQIIGGVFIQQGCAAPHSVATHDLNVFWLGKNKDGDGIVFTGRNYQATRISTPAIEYQISEYPRIDDAIGYTYMMRGHVMYVLIFPSADKTWVYDTTTGLWHEWSWLDPIEGTEHRHRSNCHAYCYGKHYVGDWVDGTVYSLQSDLYNDFGGPILRRRGFPHQLDAGNRLFFDEFSANIKCGSDKQAGDYSANPISLRWSDDRGASFGNPVEMTLGDAGEFLKQPNWVALGAARDRVFELFWEADMKTELNGAWVMVSKVDT